MGNLCDALQTRLLLFRQMYFGLIIVPVNRHVQSIWEEKPELLLNPRGGGGMMMMMMINREEEVELWSI